MTNDSSIGIVNGLIETTLDSAHGYQEAAESATNPAFKTMFTARATDRARITQTLQAEIRRLGGTPETDGTVLAAAHRMFLNLKNAVTGSDQSVVDEVEAGEDHIKAAYEKAMADSSLDVTAKGVVANAYTAIKADHDKMRDLKRSLHAAA